MVFLSSTTTAGKSLTSETNEAFQGLVLRTVKTIDQISTIPVNH